MSKYQTYYRVITIGGDTERDTRQGSTKLEIAIEYAANLVAFEIRHAIKKIGFDAVPRDRAKHWNDVFQFRIVDSQNKIIERIIVRRENIKIED